MEIDDLPREKEKRARMVKSLVDRRIFSSKLVEDAMLTVPRHLFVPSEMREGAYDDTPMPIGDGQTISAPHMVAIMVEGSGLAPGHKVLEIGAGSGYQAAVVSCVVGEKGHVYTIERLPSLARMASHNIASAGLGDNITIIHGDGSLGHPDGQPYDRIFVTCGAPRLPSPLFEQLAEGGMILIPEGGVRFQTLYEYRKKDGRMLRRGRESVMFVPLIGHHGFEE